MDAWKKLTFGIICDNRVEVAKPNKLYRNQAQNCGVVKGMLHSFIP
jgi:hypothetical protein